MLKVANIVDTDYFNEIIYTSNNDANEIIYLHKKKNHYDVITSMPAFSVKDYYCHTCKKGYSRRDKRKCPNKCLSCFKTEQHTGDKIICDKCNRTFFGQKCNEEHLRNHSKGKERDVCANSFKNVWNVNIRFPILINRCAVTRRVGIVKSIVT